MFEPAMKPIWWLPSFGFFLFLAIECWMFADPSRIFSDPGVGRHLRTAEYIVETGEIPRADPLSFSRAGEPWVDFEWGFETTVGELYRAGGLPLVCAFCYTLFAATILGIYRTLLQSGFSLSVVMITTGVAFLTLQIHFLARPVLFTYLFMALVIEVWRQRSQPLLRDWLILPIVFVAWANLHAGWLGALVFLGMSIAGRLLDRLFKRFEGEPAPILPWIGLTVVCAVAAMINPWGWTLYRHIFLMVTTLKSAAMWDEYQPPHFGLPPSMSALTVIFVVGVILLARILRRAPLWSWETILPVLFFLYEGMKAQRHVILLMEIAAVPVARDLQILLHGTWWTNLRERLKDFQDNQRIAGGDAWLGLVAAVVLAFVFVRSPEMNQITVGGVTTPRLLFFLRDHPDRFHRPLTTTWNAGPLLWNMRPDFRVSIDDRGDFYGDESVYSFVDMTKAAPGWEEKLKAGNYDSLILDPYLEINKRLSSLPEWKKVYVDEHAVIYWKDKS